jgi:hypothetical protein
MNADTKKYLTYGGIAILVGSLGYFVYSTIKKPSLSVDNTQVLIGEDENLNKPVEDNFAPAQTNVFSNLNPLPTSIGYKFPTTFNIFAK